MAIEDLQLRLGPSNLYPGPDRRRLKRLAAVQDASLRGLTRPRLAACMSKDRRCRIGPAGFIAAHSASARIGEAGEPPGWSKLVGAVT